VLLLVFDHTPLSSDQQLASAHSYHDYLIHVLHLHHLSVIRTSVCMLIDSSKLERGCAYAVPTVITKLCVGN
jgi:hypothetical protein